MKIINDLSQVMFDFTLSDIHEALRINRNRQEKGYALEATAFITYNKYANILGDTYRLLGDGLPCNLAFLRPCMTQLIG